MSAIIEIHAVQNVIAEVPDAPGRNYIEVRGIVAKSGSVSEGVQSIEPLTRKANGTDNFIEFPGIHLPTKSVPLLMIGDSTKDEVTGDAEPTTSQFKRITDKILFGFIPEYNTKIFLVHVTKP